MDDVGLDECHVVLSQAPSLVSCTFQNVFEPGGFVPSTKTKTTQCCMTKLTIGLSESWDIDLLFNYFSFPALQTFSISGPSDSSTTFAYESIMESLQQSYHKLTELRISDAANLNDDWLIEFLKATRYLNKLTLGPPSVSSPLPSKFFELMAEKQGPPPCEMREHPSAPFLPYLKDLQYEVCRDTDKFPWGLIAPIFGSLPPSPRPDGRPLKNFRLYFDWGGLDVIIPRDTLFSLLAITVTDVNLDIANEHSGADVLKDSVEYYDRLDRGELPSDEEY